ncbi:AMP-binding protein [Elongatibacter sediminis]|uniref:AMP-binding protein n=1 Tax=Elongatibacter sediminis TaxID=3119006 RepID=A0AAW9RF47_9GAMM
MSAEIFAKTNACPSIFAAFLASCDAHPQRPFLRAPACATAAYADGPIEFTYAAARSEVDRLRGHYRALGIVPGDRVGLAYDSRLDVYLHLLALNAEGASIVPLNLEGSDAEVLHVIRHSESRMIGGAGEHLDRLRTLAVEAGGITLIESEATPADEKPGEVPDKLVGAKDTEAALLYTSGTTGKPKGCILSNEYFLALGRGYTGLGGLCDIDHTDRLLTPLPPNHMNALAFSFMGMLMCGGCVIQLDRFHPRSWWRTVREEAATVIHYLGVMPAILLKLPGQADEDFGGQVKFGFGAGCDPRHQETFERRFGFPLIEGWAMTETGAGAMIVASHEPRYVGQRCFGRPGPELEFRLVDEQDRDVDSGQEGELLVRRSGPEPRLGFFSGYFRDEAATAEGWRGGWWRTGDVVREGPDGSLFFVDRRKNVIRRSGENIAAVEVEAVLLQSEAVGNCAVTAVPDEIRGDEVFAFVVPSDDAADPAGLAQNVFDFSMQHLVYFKAPGYIAVVDSLPLTASQKISRGEVKRQARRVLEENTAVDLRSLKKRRAS